MKKQKIVESTSCAQRVVYLKNGVRQGNPNKNAKRCGAKAKSTGLPCRGMAMEGKNRCRLHGGRSTGPRTQQGILNSRKGNFRHGFYTQKVVYDIKVLEKYFF